MPYTLADLVFYAQRHGWRGSLVSDTTQLKVWINDCIQRLASMRNWPCYRRAFYLRLEPPYKTGTITVQADSDVVIGNGTQWTAAAHRGQELHAGDGKPYAIAEVVSPTALRLAERYSGASAAASPYSICITSYALPSDFDRPYGGLYDEYGREISLSAVSHAEWLGLRMQNPGTATSPTNVAWFKGGPAQVAEPKFLVHPAPVMWRFVRGTYQAAPVVATDTVPPDWPERYRFLLHELLRIEISVQDGRANPVLMANFERMVDDAYRRDVQHEGPITVRVGGRMDAMDAAAAFRSAYRLVNPM